MYWSWITIARFWSWIIAILRKIRCLVKGKFLACIKSKFNSSFVSLPINFWMLFSHRYVQLSQLNGDNYDVFENVSKYWFDVRICSIQSNGMRCIYWEIFLQIRVAGFITFIEGVITFILNGTVIVLLIGRRKKTNIVLLILHLAVVGKTTFPQVHNFKSLTLMIYCRWSKTYLLPQLIDPSSFVFFFVINTLVQFLSCYFWRFYIIKKILFFVFFS